MVMVSTRLWDMLSVMVCTTELICNAMVMQLLRQTYYIRADSRLAPSQWERSLQSNAAFHWLGANLESALFMDSLGEQFILTVINICILCNSKDPRKWNHMVSFGNNESRHWGRDKMAAIILTTFSNAFLEWKYNFRLRSHWNLLLRVQLTIFQHWFK